jgi:hypothetical protein
MMRLRFVAVQFFHPSPEKRSQSLGALSLRRAIENRGQHATKTDDPLR